MRVGDYTLLSRIGEGGMGVVHLAQRSDGSQVALKVLRPHVVGDQEARERLAREVKSLGRVRSNRIAEIVDADPWGPVPFVATRYVAGPNLHDYVADHGRLSGTELLDFATGLAEALSAVHRVDVLHRDVKPTNVLMEGRDPVLIDFGLARLADDERITRTGYLMGTPGYLAPEILYGHEPTAAADVHAWASTVAFAGLGRSPYGKGPSMAVMDRVRRGEHDLDGLGYEVLSLVVAALDPDPGKRPGLDELIARMGAEATHDLSGQGSADASPTLRMPLATPSPVASSAPPPGQSSAQPSMAPSHQPYQQPPPPQNGADAPYAHPAPEPVQRVSWPVRLRRWTLGLAFLTLIASGTAAGPWLLGTLVGAVVVLFRSVSLSTSAGAQRRNRRGEKWYDVPLDVIAAPWHFIVSLPLSLLLAAWGAMLASCLALVLLVLDVEDIALLVACGLVFGISVWTGPGSSRVRQPARLLAHPLAESLLGWASACVVMLGLAAILVATASGSGIEWAPFEASPWSRDSWLSRL